MNPLEFELDYPFNDFLPEFGTALEVAPGIRWVRLPLPFALDHINAWLIRDQFGGREGWTLIDCGVARDELKAIWQQVFAEALGGLPIVRVLVTHMHPDHVGLAEWIGSRFSAPLWMTLSEYVTARLYSEGRVQGGATGGERSAAFFRSHGMQNPEDLDRIRARATYYSSLVPRVPSAYRRIMHDERIDIGGRLWQVKVGYGHSPEHASLYCEELETLISGDMVLPRISTNVSVHDDEPEGNPLKLYLASLDEYDYVPTNALILPSHGRPFRGIHTRIRQQQRHHAERLKEVRETCVEPQSALDIVPLMFKRKLDLHQLTFALGEALAHLNLLYHAGELRRINDNGVIRFVAR